MATCHWKVQFDRYLDTRYLSFARDTLRPVSIDCVDCVWYCTVAKGAVTNESSEQDGATQLEI